MTLSPEQQAVVTAPSLDILAQPKRLNQDYVTAIPLAASGTYTYDVEVAGTDWITVTADMTGGVVGDLTVTVNPFEGDNVTLSPVALVTPQNPATTPVFSGGKVYFSQRFDVIGIGRVRITAKNNNAGAQTLDLGWRTENWT